MNKLEIALNNCPNNIAIFDSFVKTDSVIPNYKKVLAAVKLRKGEIRGVNLCRIALALVDDFQIQCFFLHSLR